LNNSREKKSLGAMYARQLERKSRDAISEVREMPK